jgi:hypothetical protein
MGDRANSFFTSARNTISLNKTNEIYDSDIWNFNKNFSKIKGFVKTKSVREIKKEKYMDIIIEKNKFNLKDVLMLLNGNNEINSDLFLRYFELNPSNIQQIKNILKENDFSPELVSKIFLMLGKLGNSEAQSLLLDIWEDKTFSEAERIGAVSALTNLKNKPIDNLFDRLTSGLSNIKIGEKNSTLYSTHILICGIIVKNIKKEFPQKAQEYNESLISLLRNTEEPAQINILLLSLGNSRESSNVDIILDYLNNNDLRVFDTAVFVASKYSSSEITDLLMNKFEDKKMSSNLKANILKTLYNQPFNREQIEKMENILLTSKDASIRANTIRILGKNKNLDYNKINKVLKNAYKNETSSENIKLLIKAFEQ